MKTIELDTLATVIGGAGASAPAGTTINKAPLGGDVIQQNGWGGSLTINNNAAPAQPKMGVVEYRRMNPWAPPPYKPMPIRPFGR